MSEPDAGVPAIDGIRVGVGGWTFEPWRDTFYPDGLVQRRELEYASRLATIPDRRPQPPAMPEITVPAGADAEAYGDWILAGVDALLIDLDSEPGKPFVSGAMDHVGRDLAGMTALLQANTRQEERVVGVAEQLLDVLFGNIRVDYAGRGLCQE